MATTFLATVIGWYLVVFGLLILLRYEHVRSCMAEVMAQRGLFFLLGVITLTLGLLMVVSHNVWVMGWPVIVTILSWLVLISGVLRLFWPDAQKMGKSFLVEPMRMKIVAVVFLILGGYLLFNVYHFLLG